VWVLLLAGGGLAVFLLRQGQAACQLPPVGAQRGPAGKLQQDRVLGPPVGDLAAPGFAPPSQNPPVTTVIRSLIVSGVRGPGHNRVTQAQDVSGARYSYGATLPTLPAAPDATDASDGVDYQPPYRSTLPYVIEPSMLPGSPVPLQTRVMPGGLREAPAAPPPNTVVFADVIGPVNLRKKLGSY
jgi:hypothetical protein